MWYLVGASILLASAALVLGYLSRAGYLSGAPLLPAGFLGRAPFSFLRRTAGGRLKGSTGPRRQGEPASRPPEEERAEDALRRRARELEILFNIARILAQTEEFDEKARRVLEELARVAQAEIATLRVPDEEAQGLRLVAQRGGIAYERPGVQRFDLGVPSLAFERGLPVVANDYPAHPNAEPSAVAQGARSLVSVPVKAGRRNLGVITLASREPGHFTPERVSLLAAVADSLGTLLENARLVQDLQSSKKKMAMADEVARIVTSTLDIPKVYEKFALEMQKLVDFDRAGIHIVDLRASTLKLAYLPQSTGAIFRQGWTIPLEGTITDHVANTQRSLVLGDLDEEKRFWTVEHRRREGMRSLIMVPLISMEKVVGTFILMSRRRHAYGPREQAIVERLAAQIAPAINNSQLFQEVEQLALALESIGDTVVFHDPEGKIQFVNRAFQEVYGYCPEEVLRKDPMLLLVPGDEANQAIARESLAEGLRAGWRGEVKRLRKNGDEIDVFQTITPVKNKDGEVIGRIAVSRDITENKRVEERLREVARLSSLGELAAGVAHEINNPLTSVLGFSQLLMLEDLPQGVREDLEIVHSEANRAAKIVHNLLSFARRPDPVKMYMDVTLVLDRALEMKTYDFQVGNIEVSRDFSADLPCTMVDAQELIQVVLNILNNAEQAMRCPRGQGRLTVRTTSSKERIKVSISDDGPGIPAEHLARIFEPFFTTKAAGEGTGLGLSISYGIVHQHGGDIWAESTPGEGTTFHIELPITGGEAGGPPPPAGSPQ